MYHIIYKTSSESGKYYIGRHSTNNIDDGYVGSGTWVSNIKDKTSLKVDILKYCDTFEELKKQEKIIISENINDQLNMNWNNNSCGFGYGKLNPSCTIEGKKRLSEKNWTKTIDGKKWFSNNNPSKRNNVRTKRAEFSKKQLELGLHNFQKPKTKLNALKSNVFIFNNPSKTIEGKKKISDRLLNLSSKGLHNFQNHEFREKSRIAASNRWKNNNPMHNPDIIKKFKEPKPKITCIHCNLIGAGPSMWRYHMDNCKHKN